MSGFSALTQSSGGKAAIIVVAVVAVGAAVFIGARSIGGDQDKPVNQQAVRDAAQKQLDVISKQNLPPALKAEMMSRYGAMAQGGAKGASTPPPSH